MPRTEVHTLGAWLREAAAMLGRTGCEAPRHDAERLAAAVLGLEWGGLWTALREPIPAARLTALDDALARRAAGEPLAYITGEVVFYGLELVCGPGVLVPRPETETLVDVALELLGGVASPAVADIGTGTGAVALALVSRRPDVRAFATDRSARALAYAAANSARLGLGVELREGDLLEPLPASLRGSLDLIVSNPPYVPEGAALPPDVLREPAEALRAGPTGDEVLLRLAGLAGSWLRPGGAVALEIGTPAQAERIAAALGPAASVVLDHTGRPRVVWART